MKHRLERVNEAMKRGLAGILARENPCEGVLLTIQQVDVTPDLRSAMVYIGVIGGRVVHAEVLESLEKRRPELQALLAKEVILKYTPHLRFRIDDSVERGVRVNRILDELDIPDDPE